MKCIKIEHEFIIEILKVKIWRDLILIIILKTHILNKYPVDPKFLKILKRTSAEFLN